MRKMLSTHKKCVIRLKATKKCLIIFFLEHLKLIFCFWWLLLLVFVSRMLEEVLYSAIKKSFYQLGVEIKNVYGGLAPNIINFNF